MWVVSRKQVIEMGVMGGRRVCVCVVAQSRHLLDRLVGLGAGAGEAAKRLSRAAGLEYKWERERRAISGYNIYQFLT